MIDKISLALAVLARAVFFILHIAMVLLSTYWIATGQARPGISRWLSIPVAISGFGLLKIAYWVYNGKADELRQRLSDWGARKLSR